MPCLISALISKADPQKRTETDNIQAAWANRYYFPSEAELKTAAQLVQEGYLSSVKNMRIVNKDISEISSDNIGKLVSIVTDIVEIDDITPVSHQDPILASVQSEELRLWFMSLSEENTRDLVTAMRESVQYVTLYDVFLDPELLAAYDGQGHCTKLELVGDTRDEYETRLKRWAADRGWAVTVDNGWWLIMQRQ